MIYWISLPVHSPYLRHLFTGEYNASGCIFLDSRNTRNFTERHSILYGHHMGNGIMFNGLMDYKTGFL